MFKNKLILILVTLISCLPLTAQSTLAQEEQKPIKESVFGIQDISVINLESINSSNHDYCPVVLEKGILFTSDRPGSDRASSPDANFFISNFNENGILQKPELVKGGINSKDQEGMASMNPDGKTLVFSREVAKENSQSSFKNVRLFKAKYKKGKWTKVKKMPLNQKDVSSGHPAFSTDGTMLFFISNRPGGFGGADIYFSKYQNNKWQEPVNLGPEINSTANELFPFVDAAGNLYFSSDRDQSIGGLDIYMSSKSENGNWIIPNNLGAPINSTANDFGFYINENQTNGFLSSDRKEGLGGNDLYSWTVISSDLKERQLTFEVLNEKDHSVIRDVRVTVNEDEYPVKFWSSNDEGIVQLSTEQVKMGSIQFVHPEYYSKNIKLNSLPAKDTIRIYLNEQSCVSITGQLIDENGKRVEQTKIRIEIENHTNYQQKELFTSDDGTFNYCIPCGYDYSVKTYPDGYYGEEVFVTTRGMDCGKSEAITVMVPLIEIEEDEKTGVSTSMNELQDETSKSENSTESNSFFLNRFSTAEEINILKNETENNRIDNEIEAFDFTNILFGFDSFEIMESDQDELNILGSYLKDNPEALLTITSFTDTAGSRDYNKWLAKRRAERVVRFLTKRGVELSQLKAIAIGETDNAKFDSPVQERRVEFKIHKIKKEENYKRDIVLLPINYEFDDFQLNQASQKEIDKAIRKMREDKSLNLDVQSHTDSRGSEIYNQWLSQKRANAVKRYMVKKGIEASRINGIGFGETRLLNQCADETPCSKNQHAENRRTEFVFFQDLESK